MEIKVSCWYVIYCRRLQRLSLYVIAMDILKRLDGKIGVSSPYSAQYTHRRCQLKAAELVEIEYCVGMSTTIVVFKILVDMLSIWMYKRSDGLIEVFGPCTSRWLCRSKE